LIPGALAGLAAGPPARRRAGSWQAAAGLRL